MLNIKFLSDYFKFILLLLLSIAYQFLITFFFLTSTLQAIERSMVVIIPSYNNEEWVIRNLESVLGQNYTNYRIIYINDCSNDKTIEKIESIIDLFDNKLVIISNRYRRGALANIYYSIMSCDDFEIIITLDGDDWFADSNVLSYINQIYSDLDVWMTYGQFRIYPSNHEGFCAQVPKDIVEVNNYRRSPWTTSHLRTFYAKLFKKINPFDLLYKDEFYKVAWDLAIMYPMLEMSGNHARFIPEILYIYNTANAINDFKIYMPLIDECAEHLRRQKGYARLEKLF